MYADYFGLRELPFNNTPDPRFFYPTPEHEEALASLVYAVRERKGFVLLTGDVGAGKTLVARMMLRQLGQQLSFATINHGVHNAADLMQSVCDEFELATEAHLSVSRLVPILQDFLLAKFARDIPVALILDEAQNLPLDAFEQLRMIGNLEADDAKLLQVVIVGQPELQHRFASREFRQLKQRIFRSFHLPAMDRKTTEGYLKHRLSIAGAGVRRIFDAGAIDQVYDFSRGLPRIINTLCDNAMLSAYSADRRDVDAPFVASVIEQMMMTGPEHEDIGAEVEEAIRRVSEGIEARLTSRLANAPTAAACIGRTPVDEGVPALKAELADIRREFATEVAGLTQRVASLEQRLDHTTSTAVQTQVMEVRTMQARLQPLRDEAVGALDKAVRVSRELQQREVHLDESAGKGKALLHEMRDLLHDLTRAIAKTNRAQHAAQETHDRLVTQSGRSQQLSDQLRKVLIRLAKRGVTPESLPRILKQASVPSRSTARESLLQKAAPASVAARSPATDPWQVMLNDTRESLSELRTLVRATASGHATAPTPEPDTPLAAPARAPTEGTPPATDVGQNAHHAGATASSPSDRLARQVEDLLAMVPSDSP